MYEKNITLDLDDLYQIQAALAVRRQKFLVWDGEKQEYVVPVTYEAANLEVLIERIDESITSILTK